MTALQTWLPSHDMLTWGWRIPLLLSAPFGLVALFMRMRLKESPAYQKATAEAEAARRAIRRQYRRTIAEQWKPMLICAALVYTSNAADYMLTGYLPTYLKILVHIGHTAGLAMITGDVDHPGHSAGARRGAVRPHRRETDHVDGLRAADRRVDPGVPAHPPWQRLSADLHRVLLIGLMELCFDSTSPATMPALFPTNVRNGALAISYNVSISAFGGTTPLIAQALVSGTGNAMVPAYMLIVAGLVGAVTLLFTPEVAGKRLPGSPPAVETEQEARELVQGCD